jgi:transcriptional regulator with XRE-family HTH domain
MPKAVSYAHWSLEPYCIGAKLRLLRTQKRLTLSRLAAETGLSTALLSKLETDRMVPTLPTLATISRVYGVGMDYFFSEPARHTLSITRKAHLMGNGRSAEAVKVTALNSPAAEPQLLAQMVEFPAGGAISAADAFRETSGLVYVLEGRLQLDAGGMHEVLETGDCVYMERENTAAGYWRSCPLRCAPNPEPPPLSLIHSPTRANLRVPSLRFFSAARVGKQKAQSVWGEPLE